MKKLLICFFLLFSLVKVAEARQETLYPATALTAAVTSLGADFIVNKEEAIHVLVDLSAYTGTGNWTITVEGKWLDGTYYTVLASSALAANGLTILKIGRALTAAANTIANDAMPPVFRVKVVGAGTSTATIKVLGNFAN